MTFSPDPGSGGRRRRWGGPADTVKPGSNISARWIATRDNSVSERAALSGELRAFPDWTPRCRRGLRSGQHLVRERRLSPALHDSRLVTALVGARQYRPHFDLWTIWGAFSPVPYHAVNGSVWVRPVGGWS